MGMSVSLSSSWARSIRKWSKIIGEEMIVRLNDLDRKVSKVSRLIRAGIQ